MKKLVLALVAMLLCAGASMAGNRIVVSKKDYKLYVFDDNDSLVFQTGVCLGMNRGNKTRRGDHKTPEGKFTICSIENSTHWPDFDKVYRASYGPWFLRLKVPGFRSIGIHGTNEPESIGTRASLGCIRLHNEDIAKLKKMVRVGTPVEVLAEDAVFVMPQPKR